MENREKYEFFINRQLDGINGNGYSLEYIIGLKKGLPWLERLFEATKTMNKPFSKKMCDGAIQVCKTEWIPTILKYMKDVNAG